MIEIAYPKAADLTRVRAAIDKMNLGEFAVQSFVTEPLRPRAVELQLRRRVGAVSGQSNRSPPRP